jgi:hypothetical protein
MSTPGKTSARAFQPLVEFSGKLFAVFFRRRLVTYVTLWGFFWGMLALLFRVGTRAAGFPSAFGLTAIPFLAGLAWLHAQNDMPSDDRLLEVLDRRHHAGGLLVASAEVSINAYDSRLPRLPAPDLLWKGHREILFGGIAVLFCLGTGFIPIHLLHFGNTPMDVDFETGNLTDKIETLEKEGVISNEKAQALKNQLENLKVESTGDDPGKTLEAIDHLDELTRKSAQEASADAIKATEHLSQAEALAKELHESAAAAGDGTATRPDGAAFSEEADRAKREQAMKELAQHLKEAAQSAAFSQQALEQQLMENLQKSQLTPQQLQQIMQHCRMEKVYIYEKVKKLNNKELVDGKTLDRQQKMAGKSGEEGKSSEDGESGKSGESGQGQNGDNGSGEGKTGSGTGKGDGSMVLTPGESGGKSGSSLLLLHSPGAGAGGIGRGPGAAALNFSGSTREDRMKFTEEALPPGDFSAWKEAAVTGMAVGAPQIEGPNASKGGTIAPGQTKGSSAFSRKILPRYRPAVKRYFERK